jgi:hypothetical protein
MKYHLRLSLVCLLFLTTWGCGLRPQETTIYVIAEPGTPLRALRSSAKTDIVVTGQDMKSGKIIQNQKIDGWVTMPPSHWEVVKEKLNGVAKYEAEHNISILPLADVVPLGAK